MQQKTNGKQREKNQIRPKFRQNREDALRCSNVLSCAVWGPRNGRTIDDRVFLGFICFHRTCLYSFCTNFVQLLRQKGSVCAGALYMLCRRTLSTLTWWKDSQCEDWTFLSSRESYTKSTNAQRCHTQMHVGKSS